MFYDKKIKYLNYMMHGERVKGCGFVKVENRDNILNLEMSVTGLPLSLRAYTDVCLCTEESTYPLGQICLENGGGNFRLHNRKVAEISPVGVSYSDWRGITVLPDESCEICAYWNEETKCKLERVEVSKELTGEIKVEPQTMEMQMADKEDAICVQETVQPEPVMQEMTSTVGESVEQKSSKAKEHACTAEVIQESQLHMAEDKWEQISGIYPHIRPFHDKREYLSIRPADFVLLSEKSYQSVNNSFLLHGYHNYQHLILARSQKKGNISYYVGAPGNFFEREKQVAIMFGFTGFECARDPAREGDFGYYLMEVQL